MQSEVKNTNNHRRCFFVNIECILFRVSDIAIRDFLTEKVHQYNAQRIMYLATFEATKKWTTTIRDWAQVYGELSIMYEGRLPE